MGKKAKLKKARKQQKTTDKIQSQYTSTQFVEQFKHMGYKLPSKNKFDDQSDRSNFAPEIPQDKIEPQL
jgi:hypothetical protein